MLNKKGLGFAVTHDAWLSTMLGKAAYRVETTRAGRSGGGRDSHAHLFELEAVLGAGPTFAYAKTASDAVEDTTFLEDVGFRVIEASVQYARPVAPDETEAARLPACVVTGAEPHHREAVTALAERGFAYSRFHRDPRIPSEVADAIKAAWTANYFDGKRGDAMDVALLDGKVAGYVLLLRHGRDLVVDLIAVSPECRRKGVARFLLEHAWRSRPGVERVVAGTQVSNLGAMVMYQSLGFAPFGTGFVLHRHGE